MTMLVEISHIAEGQRLRDLSEAQIAALVDSIGEIGLLNPITVYPMQFFSDGTAVDGYGLIAGAHRLEACRRLGMVDVEAYVVELGELERQIAECDENLCGSRLTPSEKALFVRRRKQAYEALHPETRNGENQHTRVRQIGEGMAADRFTEDTAYKTGLSERTIQRNAERGKRIASEALEVVRGTDLDTGKYLDELKTIPISEQVKRAREDLKARNQSKVKRADAPLDDGDATERQVAALMTAWNKAGSEARDEFIKRVLPQETAEGKAKDG